MTASDGVRLSVRVTGVDDAPTVVLVHGYPDNGSMWDGVAALLESRFRVVVYDVRGAGRSDKPSGRKSYKLDQLSSDLASVIDEVQPEGKVHLLAHDWGSIQTWHSVTGDRLRGRLASFTSISGPSLDHAGAWFRAQVRPSPKRLKNALVQWAHSTYILGFQIPLIPQLLWRTGAMGALIGRMDPAAAAPSTSDGVHGLNLYRANMFTRLSRPQPRNAEIPVQVLAPTGDKFVTTPLQTEVDRWAPDLRVRRIVGTHWVPREKPQVIANATAELIDHVEGGDESRALKQARGSGGFANKLVVVTGAGSGIGRATALAFAAKGADLVITDINGSAAADTAKLLRDQGVTVGEYTVDSSDAEAVAKFAQRVKEEFGVPDIVVNNAGIGLSGPFLDTSLEDWERVIDVNLWGVIHGCRVFAEQMRDRAEGGQIVNVASAAAYLPSKILSAYATTKSAVLTLSVCLRAELAAENIGVTAICPGIVNTNITSTTRFVGVDDIEQKRRQKSSSKLYAKRGFGPEKVARDILRAVEKDKAIQPSTPEAKAALVLSRLTPGLLRATAKLDITP
ncbi:SDR family oxidoreductase [Amycolatopsis pittospori]|uniref:SDR family oxidoreductase n=1 Tax=Amycolatopsis pittospori TaxID=2749434 RepID=UPI0015F06C00|nr:SDR family oxidoreductase [Amycolatopsis pittospori]